MFVCSFFLGWGALREKPRRVRICSRMEMCPVICRNQQTYVSQACSTLHGGQTTYSNLRTSTLKQKNTQLFERLERQFCEHMPCDGAYVVWSRLAPEVLRPARPTEHMPLCCFCGLSAGSDCQVGLVTFLQPFRDLIWNLELQEQPWMRFER